MMTSKWTSVALTAVLLLGSCGGPARGEGTGSLTLGEAITRALEYAPEVREAELELELAELRLGSAVAAIAFPSIALEIRPPELTADGFTSDLTGTLAAGLTLPVGTSSRLSVGIDFAWDADIGALDMPRWSVLFVQSLDFSQPDAASSKVVMQQQAVADAEARLADTRERITLSAVRTYGQLLSSGAAVAQAESGHRQAEEKLEETESLVEASLRGEAALTEARLDVLEAQIRLDEQSASHAMDLEAFARETLGIVGDLALVPHEIADDELVASAASLLSQGELVESAIAASSEAAATRRGIEDAEAALGDVLREALPRLSMRAGLSEGGWSVGWTISLAFFAPDRDLRIKAAQLELTLAEQAFEVTENEVLSFILTQRAALQQAIHNSERLPLEEKKWTLEEEVMRAKLEAGSISENEWESFLEQRDAFVLEAKERSLALLIGYLSYRGALGLNLGWEEWLQ